MRTRALVTAALSLALALLVLGGCSTEFGGPSNRGSGQATGPSPARTKLALQMRDPCYSGDARAEWTRCARWEEEIAGTARTAGQAFPTDRAVTESVAAVVAGHDAFGRAGCAVPGPATTGDPGPCIGAVLQTRVGVRALAPAVGVPGV